ncbi:uncharacterized protein LOC111600714 isoform X2 [Drosophila hydei]|uniref:Uncharacterized protein LOC111600714 isoform X2 n=1 Tax=Drosophila hydei TaxID=7224 RepID=A0A6J1M789_DROHY|nr:uncharacterized protein LOC111600714 isoform X2 [Drosophila hydei]
MVATRQNHTGFSKAIFKLIRLYRANDCLWNPKSSSFKNSEMKERAWQRISKFFNYGLSVDEVKLQILLLRHYFTTELLAMKRCKLGGYTHVPRQSYFKELQFLKEAMGPSVNVKTTESEAQDRINCIVEDAFLLSSSENSIRSEQVDFQIPSSNERRIINTELQLLESESEKLPLPSFDKSARQLQRRCQSGCDRWHQQTYHDEHDNYIRQPSRSADASEHYHNCGYIGTQSVDSEFFNQAFSNQWALSYAPEMFGNHSTSLNTNLGAQAVYPKAFPARKKVLTGRYRNKPKQPAEVYNEGEDWPKYVGPNVQFRCTNDNGHNKYRSVSRHKSGVEQRYPSNKCAGLNCQMGQPIYPVENNDLTGYGNFQQNQYEVDCGCNTNLTSRNPYDPNYNQMPDNANDRLTETELGVYESDIPPQWECNESNCPNLKLNNPINSNALNQSRRRLENAQASIVSQGTEYQNGRRLTPIIRRTCDVDDEYGNGQHCSNHPEMQGIDCEPTVLCKVRAHVPSKSTIDSMQVSGAFDDSPKIIYCTDRDILNAPNAIQCPFKKPKQVQQYDDDRQMQRNDSKQERNRQSRSRGMENTSTQNRQSMSFSKARESATGKQTKSPRSSLRSNVQQSSKSNYSSEVVLEDTQQTKLDRMSENSRGSRRGLDKQRSRNSEYENRRQSVLERETKPQNKRMSSDVYESEHSRREREKMCSCYNCHSGKVSRSSHKYPENRRYSSAEKDFYKREDYRETREYNPDMPERLQTSPRNSDRRSDHYSRASAPIPENYRDMPEYNPDMPDRLQSGPRNVDRRSDQYNSARASMPENYRQTPEYSPYMPERLPTGSRNFGRQSDEYARAEDRSSERVMKHRSQSQEKHGGKPNLCCYRSKYDDNQVKEPVSTSSRYRNDMNDDETYNACVKECLSRKYPSDADTVERLEEDENFRRSDNTNQEYQIEEDYENQQTIRTTEYIPCHSDCPLRHECIIYKDCNTQEYPGDYESQLNNPAKSACHSECPVRKESTRYEDRNSRKSSTEEKVFEIQQAIRANPSCHHECPVSKESTISQDFNSRKNPTEEMDFENQPANSADKYLECHTECPARQEGFRRSQNNSQLQDASPTYQNDERVLDKTYESDNQNNYEELESFCEQGQLSENDQCKVEQTKDDDNVKAVKDCIPERFTDQQIALENMLDCECPTDEDDLQMLITKNTQETEAAKGENTANLREASVETDIDMSLHDRNNPQKGIACQCSVGGIGTTAVPQKGLREQSAKLIEDNESTLKPRPPKVNRKKICSCKPPVLYKKKCNKAPACPIKIDNVKLRSSSPVGTKSRSSSKRHNRVEDDNINRPRQLTPQSYFRNT